MSQNRFWNLLAKKLTGEISPEELSVMEQLIKEHPEWVYSAEQMETLWKTGAKTADDYDAELAFELHLNALKEKKISFPDLETQQSDPFSEPRRGFTIRRLTYVFSASACLFLAVFFLWFYRPAKPATEPVNEKYFSEVSTRSGSRTRLVLPDSSVVWVNAGSTLTYNEHFGITNRNTTLSGEAFFDVKKSTIPFIIHANGVQVKVLGTAFNVKSYPNEKTTETSLLRGRVEVTLDKRPGEKFILKPNEKLVVSNDPEKAKEEEHSKREPIVILSGLTHTNNNTIVETAWVENKLVFQDESFAELARKMERWYAISIEFKNEEIKNERLTGTFTTETVQEALEELQISTPFHFTIKSNQIIITR